ncbi:MAG: mevalonate kinase [Proteobacteria bacterium]|nr:mevalonate kinase [Pseudomonadota bacterium]
MMSGESVLNNILVPPNTTGSACGKAILIGEHAAVEGLPALALPLKEQNLEISFGEPVFLKDQAVSNGAASADYGLWNSCWTLSINDKIQVLPDSERARLSRTLELALQLLVRRDVSLTQFLPQFVRIRSRLPLGAGMGGSAAVSAALLRALSSAHGKSLTGSEIASLANELDGVFHGRASGLDAATVVADSIICFRKNHGSRPVPNKKGFWLFLVDTAERTPTREMVARVAQLRLSEPALVEANFTEIGRLAQGCETDLRNGELVALGDKLNQAHRCLSAIGVSTPLLDQCVDDLRLAGALGAKLTGGGGGGLALGIFENQPRLPLNDGWADYPHFLTFVPAEKSS